MELEYLESVKPESFRQRDGLPNFFDKLKKGKDVCIGYLGGSITLAEGYRPKTARWFQEEYPNSKISHVNAGIGGTGSTLGVCRANKDILSHNPDMVFVEFATNDCEHTEKEWCLNAMEGIVRKIWDNNPETDICFLYTINLVQREALSNGRCYWTSAIMEHLAEHYGIPSINVGVEVVRLEKEEKLVYKVEKNSKEEKITRESGRIVFSYDNVHPTLDNGHDLYTKIIKQCMKKMADSPTPCGARRVPEPLGETPWTNAALLPLSVAEMSPEWEVVNPAIEGLTCENLSRLEPLCKADKPGASIKFKFKGRGFGIFGIFGLNSGQFKINIDGEEYGKAPLFDMYGNVYRVHYKLIACNLEDIEHEVVMTLDSELPDRTNLKPGRLVNDPKKMEGLVCYIGGLLII